MAVCTVVVGYMFDTVSGVAAMSLAKFSTPVLANTN